MENSLTFTQMYPLKLSKYLSMNQMNMKVGSQFMYAMEQYKYQLGKQVQ